MKVASLIILLFSALSISAQNKTLKWSTELCEYQGTFNAKKYTSAQLRNTLRLSTPGEFSINSNATAFDVADIAKLSAAGLEKEYVTMAAQLRALDIVKTPYWEQRRERKLAEIKQVYELSLVSIQAYQDPKALNGLNWAESCKTKYAAPLIAGGTTLFQTWLAVNLDSRSKNGDPERLRRIFEQQSASRDRVIYARVEVMTFGWWNCANEFIKYVDDNDTPDREFKKLFVRVRTIHCDEP